MVRLADNLGTEPRVPYKAECAACGTTTYGAAPAGAVDLQCPECGRFVRLHRLPATEATDD